MSFLKDIKYCIWDFNGTILDDVDVGIASVNEMLSERGLPLIKSREYYHSVFRFPIIEYYKDLGFDFEREPYEVLAPIWVDLYMKNVKTAKAFDDVISAIKLFKSKGISQIIISATEINMLREQLSSLGIIEYFDGIFGLDNIHAGSKLAIAKSWREEHNDGNAIFIGDTDHDVETAKTLGAECFLIARGHQSKEHLIACPSAIVCSDMSEVISLIDK